MPTSLLLKRLLRIRQLQEEQSQAALKTASGNLSLLRQAVERAQTRQARGKSLFISGAAAEDATDRIAGLCETQCAWAREQRLVKEVRQAEIAHQRQLAELTAAHQERRKGELLVDAAEQKMNADVKRQQQKELDELHRHRAK